MWGKVLGGIAGTGIGAIVAGPGGAGVGAGIGGSIGQGLGGAIGSTYDEAPTMAFQQPQQSVSGPVGLSAFEQPQTAFLQQGDRSREEYRAYLQDIFLRNEQDEIGRYA